MFTPRCNLVYPLIVALLLTAPKNCAASADGILNSSRTYAARTEISRSNGILAVSPEPSDIKVIRLLGANNIGSLKEYSSWLAKAVSYRSDSTTKSWTPWEETIERGYGDCKGFALLNYAFLSALGYKPLIMVMGDCYGSHAICACEEGGYYFWFDNEKLKITGARSMRDFCEFILAECDCSYILNVDAKNKDAELLLTKADLSSRSTLPQGTP